MKVNEIEKLLARYYDGETTETEEKELKRFFTTEEIPTHLLAEKEFFLQLNGSREETPMPEGLGNRLNSLIDEWDTREKRMMKVKKHARIIRMQWIGSIAASLLILVSVGMYVYKPSSEPTPQDTCATPEEAYAQAQKALLIFSTSLNKGVEQIQTMEETTDKIRESVNKQLNLVNK